VEFLASVMEIVKILCRQYKRSSERWNFSSTRPCSENNVFQGDREVWKRAAPFKRRIVVGLRFLEIPRLQDMDSV